MIETKLSSRERLRVPYNSGINHINDLHQIPKEKESVTNIASVNPNLAKN